MNIKYLLTTCAMSMVLVLPGCWPTKKHNEGSEATSNLHVLNVLDPEQYNECHIPGSVNVPFDKVQEYAQDLDKNAEVIVYCSNYQCSASAQVVKQLKELGFEKVAAYEGGIAEWYQQGLPVEGTCAEGIPVSEYLTKVVERSHDAEAEIPLITADALKEKLTATGALKLEQVSVPATPTA